MSAEETTVAVLGDREVRSALHGTGSNYLPTNALEVGFESTAVFYLRVIARSTANAPVIAAA